MSSEIMKLDREKTLEYLKKEKNLDWKTILAIALNDDDFLEKLKLFLVKNGNWKTRLAIALLPNISKDLVGRLAKDINSNIRYIIASRKDWDMSGKCEDIMKELAKDKNNKIQIKAKKRLERIKYWREAEKENRARKNAIFDSWEKKIKKK